jgi:hypothetical protein
MLQRKVQRRIFGPPKREEVRKGDSYIIKEL